jgi:hypothetical protein
VFEKATVAKTRKTKCFQAEVRSAHAAVSAASTPTIESAMGRDNDVRGATAQQ